MATDMNAPQKKQLVQLKTLFTLIALEGMMSLIALVSIAKDPTNTWIVGLSKSRFVLAAGIALLTLLFLVLAIKAWMDEAWSRKIAQQGRETLTSKRAAIIVFILAWILVLLGGATLVLLFVRSDSPLHSYTVRLAPLLLWGALIGIKILILLPRWSQDWQEFNQPRQARIADVLSRTSPFHIGKASPNLIIAFLIVAGLVALVFWSRNKVGLFVIDDAWITFRYAKHLAAGQGLTWEPAASIPTEGYSNLLEVLVAAAALRVNASPVAVVRTVSILATVAILTVLYLHMTELTGSRWLAILPLGLYALHPYTAIHTWAGLATQWFVALNVLILFFFWRALARETADGANRWLAPLMLTILAVLVTITRTEGLFIGFSALALAALFHWKRDRKPWLTALVSYIVLFIGYTLFRWLYFGTLLTGPSLVKLSNEMMLGLISREYWLDGLTYLRTSPLGIFTLTLFPFALGLVLQVKVYCQENKKNLADRAVLLLAVLQFLALNAVYARTNMIQNFASRFFAQSAAQQLVIITLVSAWLYRVWFSFRLEPQKNIPRAILFWVAVVGLGISTLTWAGDLDALNRSYAKFVREYNQQQSAAKAIAEALNQHGEQLQDEWLVTVVDSGILPYYVDMNVLGGDGLTDLHLSPLVPPQGEKAEPYAEYIFSHQPAVFVIEVYGQHLDVHHRALVCSPEFSEYQFVGGLKRAQGPAYNLYLRQDLPTFDAIAEQIQSLSDPQQRWSVSYENAHMTCPQ
jgi:flagellar basal body-associated protein FliL